MGEEITRAIAEQADQLAKYRIVSNARIHHLEQVALEVAEKLEAEAERTDSAWLRSLAARLRSGVDDE